jgi:hypothetical protein
VGVETEVDRAIERARAEREAFAAKLEAFESFADRVSDLRTASSGSTGAGVTATTGSRARATDAADSCRAVRTAFAETVRPHSVADVDDPEPLLATVRSEFTESIAVALAPTAATAFTDELQRAILSETRDRMAEAETLRAAIEREESALFEAAETVTGVTTWLTEAEETPLSELGFEGLRRRHEDLSDRRRECEELARKRQCFLAETTGKRPARGVQHGEVIQFLYRDFSVDNPVLATAARLDDLCRECQRAVRAHLTTRG